MVTELRDYDIQECSLMKNMADIRAFLVANHPTVSPMTLFLFEYDLDRLKTEVQDSNILVIFGLGPTNPFEASTRKIHRIIKFRVEFKNISNREHVHVINSIREFFKPGLSYKQWNSNGSDNIVDYTEVK